MTATVLCLMALVDGALAGFRAWAGRDGRVVKRNARLKSAVRGATGAFAALILIATILIALLLASSVAYEELVAAGNRMILVYAPFCLLVSLGFLGYFSASLEWQALSTVLVLGPATFVRPLVIVGGVVAASWGTSGWTVVAASVSAVLIMVVELVLNRIYSRELAQHPFG